MTQRSSKMAWWRPRLGAGMAGFAALVALIFGVRTALVQGPIGGETIENGCMQDVYDQYNDGQVDGDTLNCTANDIEIASVTNINITDDGCAFPGDTVTFDFTAAVQLTAQARHDIGIYFAIDGDPSGDGALTGACSISTLPYAGEFENPDFGTGYYVDLDGTDDDPGGTIQDTCGDIEDSAAQVPNETNPILVDIAGITAVCNDADGDGNLDLPYATSWRQPGANELCTSPLNAFPGGPAKCNTDAGFSVPIPVPKAIEVRKALVPVDDPGRFNLQIDGITDPDAENVGNGGSTGKEAIDAGTHSVGEEGYGDTDLNDFSVSIACVDQSGRCSGDNTIHCVNDAVCTANDAGTCEFTNPVVASCTDCTSLQVEVPNKPSDIVCTITNERRPGYLEVVKELVPSGDPGLFNLQIDGVTDPDAADVGDGGSTGKEALAPGTHTVGETAGTSTDLSDYTIDIKCVDRGTETFGGGAPLTATGPGPLDVQVDSNDDIVCTITNERRPGYLEVLKELVPSDDPGLFNLQINGVTDPDAADVGDGGSTGKEALAPGTHTVGETAGTSTDLSDYTIDIKCVDRGTETFGGGAPLTATGPGPLDVQVDSNDDIVCTITNEVKTSSITIMKETDPPDDEVFDFTSNTTPDAFSLSHDGSQPFPDLQPNATYAFTETVPADWELKAIICTGQDNSLVAYGDTAVTIDLAPDEALMCTFTDDPLPVITVVKSADPLRVANPGDPVTYTVQVTNNTPAGEPVTLTSLSDDIYGDLTYAGNPSLSITTCELVTIQAGEPYSCYFVAGVIGEWGRSTTDTVTATAEDDEGNTAQDDDIATVTIEEEIPLEMTVVKTADPEAILAPGGPVTYKVEVTNNGLANMQLTLTSLVDTVYGDVTDPSNLKLLSTTCGKGSTIDPQSTYECEFQAEVTGEAGYVETDIVSATAVDPFGREVQDYDDATVLIYVKPPDTGVELPAPLIIGALAAIGAALLAVGLYVRQQTLRVG